MSRKSRRQRPGKDGELIGDFEEFLDAVLDGKKDDLVAFIEEKTANGVLLAMRQWSTAVSDAESAVKGRAFWSKLGAWFAETAGKEDLSNDEGEVYKSISYLIHALTKDFRKAKRNRLKTELISNGVDMARIAGYTHQFADAFICTVTNPTYIKGGVFTKENLPNWLLLDPPDGKFSKALKCVVDIGWDFFFYIRKKRFVETDPNKRPRLPKGVDPDDYIDVRSFYDAQMLEKHWQSTEKDEQRFALAVYKVAFCIAPHDPPTIIHMDKCLRNLAVLVGRDSVFESMKARRMKSLLKWALTSEAFATSKASTWLTMFQFGSEAVGKLLWYMLHRLEFVNKVVATSWGLIVAKAVRWWFGRKCPDAIVQGFSAFLGDMCALALRGGNDIESGGLTMQQAAFAFIEGYRKLKPQSRGEIRLMFSQVFLQVNEAMLAENVRVQENGMRLYFALYPVPLPLNENPEELPEYNETWENPINHPDDLLEHPPRVRREKALSGLVSQTQRMFDLLKEDHMDCRLIACEGVCRAIQRHVGEEYISEPDAKMLIRRIYHVFYIEVPVAQMAMMKSLADGLYAAEGERRECYRRAARAHIVSIMERLFRKDWNGLKALEPELLGNVCRIVVDTHSESRLKKLRQDDSIRSILSMPFVLLDPEKGRASETPDCEKYVSQFILHTLSFSSSNELQRLNALVKLIRVNLDSTLKVLQHSEVTVDQAMALLVLINRVLRNVVKQTREPRGCDDDGSDDEDEVFYNGLPGEDPWLHDDMPLFFMDMSICKGVLDVASYLWIANKEAFMEKGQVYEQLVKVYTAVLPKLLKSNKNYELEVVHLASVHPLTNAVGLGDLVLRRIAVLDQLQILPKSKDYDEVTSQLVKDKYVAAAVRWGLVKEIIRYVIQEIRRKGGPEQSEEDETEDFYDDTDEEVRRGARGRKKGKRGAPQVEKEKNTIDYRKVIVALKSVEYIVKTEELRGIAEETCPHKWDKLLNYIYNKVSSATVRAFEEVGAFVEEGEPVSDEKLAYIRNAHRCLMTCSVLLSPPRTKFQPEVENPALENATIPMLKWIKESVLSKAGSQRLQPLVYAIVGDTLSWAAAAIRRHVYPTQFFTAVQLLLCAVASTNMSWINKEVLKGYLELCCSTNWYYTHSALVDFMEETETLMVRCYMEGFRAALSGKAAIQERGQMFSLMDNLWRDLTDRYHLAASRQWPDPNTKDPITVEERFPAFTALVKITFPRIRYRVEKINGVLRDDIYDEDDDDYYTPRYPPAPSARIEAVASARDALAIDFDDDDDVVDKSTRAAGFHDVDYDARRREEEDLLEEFDEEDLIEEVDEEEDLLEEVDEEDLLEEVEEEGDYQEETTPQEHLNVHQLSAIAEEEEESPNPEFGSGFNQYHRSSEAEDEDYDSLAQPLPGWGGMAVGGGYPGTSSSAVAAVSSDEDDGATRKRRKKSRKKSHEKRETVQERVGRRTRRSGIELEA